MSTVVSVRPGADFQAAGSVSSWLRWGLVVWWLLSAAAVAAVGERASTMPALLAAVDAGRVSEVQVFGALPPGATGSGIEVIRWRQDGLARYAEARYSSPGYTPDAGSLSPPAETATVDAATMLHRHNAQVRVRVQTSPAMTGSTSTIWLWRVPLWLGGLGAAGLLLSFMLLAGGPEPWRMTRWAWAWAILLAPPVGTLAFALLSGPMPPVPAPRNDARRLTGGWAFILVSALGTTFRPS
jgi:hypothetical protein